MDTHEYIHTVQVDTDRESSLLGAVRWRKLLLEASTAV